MYASPDSLSGLAGYINREYGGHGYHVSHIEGIQMFGILATVHHSDGSEFKVTVDRYGNAATVPEAVVA